MPSSDLSLLSLFSWAMKMGQQRPTKRRHAQGMLDETDPFKPKVIFNPGGGYHDLENFIRNIKFKFLDFDPNQ